MPETARPDVGLSPPGPAETHVISRALAVVALADRWRDLEDLPAGTLGRRVAAFYRARGFVHPELPGSAPPLADLPVQEARRHFGIPAKSPQARAAGAVGPWDPGGISEFQRRAGRELAARSGMRLPADHPKEP